MSRARRRTRFDGPSADPGAENRTDVVTAAEMPSDEPTLWPRLRLPLAYAAGTTALVTALSWLAPAKHAATAVGLGFLAATWWLVLRGDEARVRHFGVSLGGVFERSPLDWSRIARESARAVGGGLLLAAIVFPPFFFGYRFWHHGAHFHFTWPARLWDDAAGQVLVIALPEEAFFRGYLQTSLTDGFGGASGDLVDGNEIRAILITSAIFAVGHILTDPRPARLAVFFPSLLFGLVRAKTRGVGTGLVFHALCNLYVATLARGFAP